jgi:hypothetical protein
MWMLLILLLSSYYVWIIIHPLRHISHRLVLSLPICVANVVLPVVIYDAKTQVFWRGLTGCLAAWIFNFRLIAFAMQSEHSFLLKEKRNFWRFSAMLILPIRLGKNKTFSSRMFMICALKLVGTYIGCWIDEKFESSGNPYLLAYNLYFGQAWIAYWLASALFDLSACMCFLYFDLPLQPAFNSPFLSSSFSDFWGKRWNLVISNLLRDTIYLPLQKHSSSKSMALLSSFVVSSFMHALIFFYASDEIHYEWFGFFLVQGFFVLVESYLFRKNVVIKNSLLWRIIVIFVMLLTGKIWFIEPLYRSRASIHVRDLILMKL